jgi:magnesium-transporting ATPase (P-type)
MGAYYFAYWSTGWRPGQPMADSGPTYALATTLTFAAVVSTQIGNAFAQRTGRNSVRRVRFTGNRLLLVGVAVEVALLALLVYTPALSSVFGFAPLRPMDWLLLVALAPTLLIADEIRKSIAHRNRHTGYAQGNRRVWEGGVRARPEVPA